MNKKILIIIIAALVIGIAGGVYFFKKSNDKDKADFTATNVNVELLLIDK